MSEYKANINWYPGHMAKAKNDLLKDIKMVDLVIELKDARIPISSTNPMVDEIAKQKPRLILLNKANMADEKITKEWINYYKNNNIIALDIDCISKYNIKLIEKYAKLALKETFEKRRAKGIKSEAIKAMILGIPNVGKSTLINTLANKKKTNVGNKPGVTKIISWIKVSDDFLILDTPGILWPKFEDEIGYNLAICGSIKDDILNIDDVLVKALDYIKIYYKDLLLKRYELESLDDSSYEIINQIAKKKGMLLAGGKLDYMRAVTLIINDIRSIKVGRITYERPI